MRHKKSMKIAWKIAALPIMGVLALFLVKGIDFLLNHAAGKALTVNLRARDTLHEMSELLRLETEFLSTARIDTLSNVDPAMQNVLDSIGEANSANTNEDFALILNQLKEAATEHKVLFDKAVTIVGQLSMEQDGVSKSFQAVDAKISQGIDLVAKEEYETAFSNGTMDTGKTALRSALKDFGQLTSKQVINTTELIAFNNGDSFHTKVPTLREQSQLIITCINNLLGGVKEKTYHDLWDASKEAYTSLETATDRLYDRWKERQDITERLFESNKMIQIYADRLVEVAQAEMDETRRFQSILQISVVIAAILCLVGLSILAMKATLPPIKEITATIESIAKGDYSKNILYEAKDEVGSMASSLRKLVGAQRRHADLLLAVADGDLTKNADILSDKDILGNALSKMIEDLTVVLLEVQTMTTKVSAGATQITASAQALSSGAAEQAAAMEQITSSISEIGSQTKNNADKAAHANKIASASQGSVAKGRQRIEAMIDSMSEISQASTQIHKVIKVIDDIAFQTNLLALNAAIEAARAGKAGKGFAVVAAEVRSLAGRSAQAAQETASLITLSTEKVERGVKLAHENVEGLAEIASHVNEVASLMNGIATASEQQSLGLEQMTGALRQIDSVTQQNTANAEQTSAAATDLSKSVLFLKTVLEHFQLRSAPEGQGQAFGQLDKAA